MLPHWLERPPAVWEAGARARLSTVSKCWTHCKLWRDGWAARVGAAVALGHGWPVGTCGRCHGKCPRRPPHLSCYLNIEATGPLRRVCTGGRKGGWHVPVLPRPLGECTELLCKAASFMLRQPCGWCCWAESANPHKMPGRVERPRVVGQGRLQKAAG